MLLGTAVFFQSADTTFQGRGTGLIVPVWIVTNGSICMCMLSLMSFQRLPGEAEWWVEWASTLSFVQSMSVLRRFRGGGCYRGLEHLARWPDPVQCLDKLHID